MWPPRLLRWTVTILLVVAVIAHASASNSVRRRIRKPSKISTSVSTSVSRSTDQVISASVNRPKIRGRPSIASRKSSAAIDNSVGTDDHKDKDGYKVVCYYTNWSQYRTKIGKFTPEDIQPDLCTHIIFAFGWMKKGKLSSFESNDETKDGKTGLYDKINGLKKANPKLKTLIAIGGWSFGTQKFKEMSATRYSRQTFIYSAIPYLRDRNFDGLDVDWEYPKGGDDKKNYVLLLKELREAFEAEAQEVKKPRLLLTAAVPVGPDNIKSGYDVPAVASYLDFINLMAYDFHGKWERETGHNAPLYAPSSDSEWRKQLSVDHAAHLWVKLGAPKEKLIIGMPTYGRTFTLSNMNNFKVNSPASGGGKAGEYTKESGFLAYYEVCEMLRNGGAYVWDDEMKVPYAISGDQWVGFDDEKSIRHKMRWIKDNGFGGAMVWTVDMDDFSGSVCGGDVKYPLIGAMRTYYMMSLQEFIMKQFESWKPLPPEVQKRSSRDVTLVFSAGPFSFLKNRLIYRVDKKEKIPPWITVYSGGKSTNTIDNLAPSHPHRFRFKVIIKSSAIKDLERAAIEHYGDEKNVYEVLNEIDESEDLKQSKENNSSGVDDKAKSVPSYTMDCEKQLLSRQIFEEKPIEKSGGYIGSVTSRQQKWLSSQWSEETWTSTDSDGTSVVCFCMAVRCGYLKQVQQMLEDRPTLISVVNANNGYTPLATAARKGDVSMVRFLLSANAEIEQPSSTGQTPLQLAVLAGHVAVADLLLEKGADSQARDFNKLRIEHYAVDSCKLEMVKYIFAKGGDVYVRDSNAWTPLFRAVCQGAKTDIIEELVRRGSDVEVVDRAGLSVAAAARLLKDRHGRRRESVLRLVDSQFQHEKVVANFTRLTKKISSVHTLLSIK